MIRCGRWSARPDDRRAAAGVSLACGVQPAADPATSRPRQPSEFGGAACRVGTAIDYYLAHGAVNLRNIRAVLVSQRGELVAERYYHSERRGTPRSIQRLKCPLHLVGIALIKAI